MFWDPQRADHRRDPGYRSVVIAAQVAVVLCGLDPPDIDAGAIDAQVGYVVCQHVGIEREQTEVGPCLEAEDDVGAEDVVDVHALRLAGHREATAWVTAVERVRDRPRAVEISL